MVIHVKNIQGGASQSSVIQGLVAEIKSRLKDVEATERLLVLGDLAIDPGRREVTRGSRRIHLTPREWALLEYLVFHRDHVLPEARLMKDLFSNAKAARLCNTLYVHMHRLRKKIDAECDVRLIHTIRGVGYIVRTPLRVVSVSAANEALAS